MSDQCSQVRRMFNSAGRVEISWAEEPKTSELSLNWKEQLGPPIDQPTRPASVQDF
jgi:two-component sensor histidine kinase